MRDNKQRTGRNSNSNSEVNPTDQNNMKNESELNKKTKNPKDFTGGKRETPGTFMAFAKSNMSAEEIADCIAMGNSKLVGRENNFMHDKEIWLSLIEVLQEQKLVPTIVFFFDRNRLEGTMKLLESVDLLDKAEKNDVKHFLKCALHQRLKNNDRYLPNVINVCKLAERGLGIHHARMLPLMKEVVEMLFARGHIRILFSTETFAMGVNMPARCVVFSTLRKFDGNQKRFITSSEYTQMAGRAGRRGLDSVGKVLILVNSPDSHLYRNDPPPTESELKQVITGKATQLQSKFRITYSMILLLHRVEWITPQEVMRKSFREASGVHNEPKLLKNRLILEDRIAAYGSGQEENNLLYQIFSAWNNEEIEGFLSLSELPGEQATCQIPCPSLKLQADLQLFLDPCSDRIFEYYTAALRYQIMRNDYFNNLGKINLDSRRKLLVPGRLVIFEEEAPLNSTSYTVNKLKAGLILSHEKNWSVGDFSLEILTYDSLDEKFLTIFDESYASKRLNPERSLLQATSSHLTRVIDEEDQVEDAIFTSSKTFPYPPQLLHRERPMDQQTVYTKLSILSNVSFDQVHIISSMVIEAKGSLMAKETFIESIRQFIKNFKILSKMSGKFKSIIKADKDVENYLTNVSGTFVKLQDDLYQHLDLKIPALDFYSLVHIEKFENIQLSLLASMLLENVDESDSSLLMNCCLPRRHLNRIHRHFRRLCELVQIKYQLSDDALSLHDQYKARLRLLKEWDFIDRASAIGCITTKGRVACEIQTCEILITQMLFDGLFTNHTPIELAALFSCFVCENRPSQKRKQRSQAKNPANPASAAMEINHDESNQELSFNMSTMTIDDENDEMKKRQILDTQLSLDDEQFTDDSIEDLLERCNVTEEKRLDVKNALIEILARYTDSEVEASADTEIGKKFLASIMTQAMYVVPSVLRPTIQKMLVKRAELQVLQDHLGIESRANDTRMMLDLVKVTYIWALGSSFSSVIEMTDVPEGDVVRTFQRLDELLRHVHSSCYFLGDSVMAVALDESRELIRRGIVSIPSLYVSEEANDEEIKE